MAFCVVCFFHCVDSEMALINVNNRHERELCVGLRILDVEMRLGHFRNVFFSLSLSFLNSCTSL
jgi:hypothetical protein